MSERGSFYRKITYLVLIAVLLFPISQLGAPSSIEDEGGKLAQLRAEYDLGQSDLGEIDPASETIRLATLGLRGIAVSLLWNKAQEYKKKEDWTSFRATLGQLAKLQPYFISFWRYQAWNLTYNISVELDDVRDRFYYVKRGIEFLKQGIKYNRDSPYLLTELGWFIGNKIGRADEKKEYRRLFKADDDFHPADRLPEQRDNWLVSRQWYEAAVSTVDDKKRSLGKKNPTVFFARPAMSQIYYGEAIEREGTFGEKARSAWATAGRLWRNFGNREMRASTGVVIRLADVEHWQQEVEKLNSQLSALVPDAREQFLAQRRAEMTPEQRKAVDTPANELSEDQYVHLSEASRLLNFGIVELADYAAQKWPDKSAGVRKLANRITEIDSRIRLTMINRDVSNFEYWQQRCQIEQTIAVLRAREQAYLARRAFRDDADLTTAKRLYEESFDLWAQVFKDIPELPLDSPTSVDIMEFVEQYAEVLEQLDLNLSDEAVDRQFPLWDLVVMNDQERKFDEAIKEHFSRLEKAQ